MSAVEWLDAMRRVATRRLRARADAHAPRPRSENPQDTYPAIHVVGTNGKSTATVTIEHLLLSEGQTPERRSRRTSCAGGSAFV